MASDQKPTRNSAAKKSKKPGKLVTPKKTTVNDKSNRRSRLTKGKRPKSEIFKRLFYWAAVTGVWAFIALFLTFLFLAHDLPDLDNLPPPGAGDTAVVVKAANGATLVRYGPVYGDFLKYNQIPDSMIQAIVSVEDKRFFGHNGFDARGFTRAVYDNIMAGGIRAGGSTLTQQLAKNMFLTSEQNFTRKARELLLAFWLEQKFTKQEILTLYLNRVYFGGGAYGIDAASRKFFGQSASRLTVSQSAMLAGLVKAPSRLAPHINPVGAWDRGKIVLTLLADDGKITDDAADRLKTRPPRIVAPVTGQDIRYFTDWINTRINRLIKAKGQSVIVHTTLDPGTQAAAAAALSHGLSGEGVTRKASQGAIIAMDPGGAVQAMVGGENYGRSQFNRAVDAKRQPGSTFKLFTYLAALEGGMKSAKKFTDEAIDIDGYKPGNYDGEFHGRMSAREAFTRSINTIAVQIGETVGQEKIVEMAKRLGIKSPLQPITSLPLGTEEVSVLDLNGAFASIANGGHKVDPYAIIEITSLSGQVLYRKPRARLEPVLVRKHAEEMAEMLEQVIIAGSGKNARIDRPAAGKTGTTQNYRDALFAGFTSDLVATVWVGNDDDTPMNRVTGGGLPARIWADFMLEAHAGAPVRPILSDAGLYRAMGEDER